MDRDAWPRRGFWLFAVLHLIVWTAVAGLTQPNVPLDTIEVVAWGHEWQLGYQNHPPLTAWLAELARQAGGRHGDWALYLLTQVAVVTALWGLWRLALHVVGAPTALIVVLVTGVASRYTWMTLEFNHNAVVLPCFSLGVLCFYRALTTRASRWWALTGVCLGLGVLAKYTIVTLGVSMLLFLIADPRARQAARGRGPWIALGVATLILVPHLVWLIAHGFPTIAYAAGRAGNHAGLAGHLIHPLDFLANQLLSMGLTLLAALAMLWWPPRLRAASDIDPWKRRFLLATGLGPPALVVLGSFVTGVALRPAWGMPFWTGLALLLLGSFEARVGRPALRRAAVFWVVGVLLNVLMAAAEGLSPHMTGEGARIQFPGRLLAERVTLIWHRRFGTPLTRVGGERWLTGNVNFYAASRPSVFTNFGLHAPDPDEPACPWTSVADFRRRGGVLLWLADRDGPELPPGLRDRFPDALTLAPLVLPWQTTAALPPVRVGMALVAPAAAVPPR
jgi:hypothetical protein